jgi:gliding motility-associated-like protein
LTVVPNVPTTPLFTTTIEKGATVQLQGPAGFASYAWTPNYKLDCTDCQNPTASPDTSTTYTVKVTNAGGCTGEAVYRVIVAPPCFENVLVPNAFTPNNDTINNYLQVILNEGQFEKVVRLQVYNRWGQRIFDATDDPRWDGNVGGKPAPMDVYIFIFDIECNGKTKRLLEREVTLIR